MNDSQTYYARFKEARKAYQRCYYERNKEVIRRKKELDATLHPEKFQKIRGYQREYYLKNREKLLQRKRERYAHKKALRDQ
jgi:hypothetical protein